MDIPDLWPNMDWWVWVNIQFWIVFFIVAGRGRRSAANRKQETDDSDTINNSRGY